MKGRIFIVVAVMILMQTASASAFRHGTDWIKSERGFYPPERFPPKKVVPECPPANVFEGGISVGMPTIIPQGVEPHGVPLSDYGILPAQMPSEALMSAVMVIDDRNYSTYLSNLKLAMGEKEFKKLMDNIRVRPSVFNVFPPTHELRLETKLPEGAMFKVVAILTAYSKKLDKNIPVFRENILLSAYPYATKNGADVIMLGRDFYRLHLIPEGKAFGLTGLFEALFEVGSENYPGAAGISPFFSGIKHQSTVDADLASTYFALKLVGKPSPPRIYTGLIRCPYPEPKNAAQRIAAARIAIEHFQKTVDLEWQAKFLDEAYLHLNQALRDHPARTQRMEILKLLSAVWYEKSFFVSEAEREIYLDYAGKYAREANLEGIPFLRIH